MLVLIEKKSIVFDFSEMLMVMASTRAHKNGRLG